MLSCCTHEAYPRMTQCILGLAEAQHSTALSVCVIGLVSPTAEWYSHICPNREAFVMACRCGAAKTLTICLCKHLQYSIQ